MRNPNFMCLGAPKCGTTTLYDILKNHTDIYLTSFKEPHFFDITSNYSKGYNWYIDEYYKGAGSQKVIGEFTPSYLVVPGVPKRIRKDIGDDIKYIVVLRNPVDRAYSQYLHAKRDLIECLDFEESLEAEEKRLNKFEKEKDDISYIRLSYVQGGLYSALLKRFFKEFDKSQFKVVIFEEEFMSDRSALVSSILSFLNVKDEVLEVDIKSNQVAGVRFHFIKNILKGDSKVRRVMKSLIRSQKLRGQISYFMQKVSNKPIKKDELEHGMKVNIMNKYFLEDIKELEKLIGRDLSVWYQNK